ncbi:MAG: carboxypeptidase regulatory-like domain-containing protein [Acidobacteria bacterium]|nr:carboxypeptidase regulatory-like domain-containing protein [Acidobacteriota bacterium]
MHPLSRILVPLLLVASFAHAQTSAEMLGTVSDSSTAAVAEAKITARNLSTNLTYNTTSSNAGTYRLPLLPPGEYELVVEKAGFAKHVRRPITLQLNQQAELNVALHVATASEVITVSTESPLINTTNAEVGFNIDAKRISELPISPNRNILNIVLQAPGVSQLSSGNESRANSLNFSVNGMRLRSNNFMIDGADSNNASVAGMVQEINNPDVVAEFRLITNQFLPEYGRAAGSVVNILTKGGTNQMHGTAYWSYNSNVMNSRTNLDKRSFAKAPWRVEDQFGGTFGGPAIKNRTFLFGSLLRWTDHRFASGTAITGAPTAEGRTALQSISAGRPQIAALLKYLPAAQQPSGQAFTVNADGRSVVVPVGTLSGAAPNKLDVWQWSGRVDHRINEKNNLMGRILYDDRVSISGQAVPLGLTSLVPSRRQAYNSTLTSTLSPRAFNELRFNYQRLFNSQSASNPEALGVPSIEINTLGLQGFNSSDARTALGFAINLPTILVTNNYQIANNFGLIRGKHSMKFGGDIRRAEQFQEFNALVRGRLQYNNLQDFVDDLAQAQTINKLLPGLRNWQFYRYYDFFFFAQDEWRIKRNLTLTYGLRYETPGNPFNWLASENRRVVAENNNNPAYVMDKGPSRDINNFAPRLGFNYRFGKSSGVLGALLGDNKTVLRGGYSRTYDLAFNNMLLNIYSAWPFTNALARPARSPESFVTIDAIRRGGTAPLPANLMSIARTVLNDSFRAPIAEQYSMQIQREFGGGLGLNVGYVATKGTGLFQSVDGNPTVPGSGGTRRVDNSRGVLRLRANTGSSTYHSLQTSLEKRFSKGYQFSAHYTWSTFIDDQSDIFNASVSGEVAVAQDSLNRRSEKGRSTYDRPHRFSVNGIYEVPLGRNTKNAISHLIGGWQLGGFLTFQSGAPFSALAGNDPGFRLSGIDALIGNSLRPHLATNLAVSSQSVEQLFAVRSTLFSPLSAANPIGNAGRNIIRADGIANVDMVINKKIRLPFEGHVMNFRGEFYNLANSRDFGIPNATFSSAAFLNQWNTNGGGRRIVMLLRYQF